MCILGKAGTRRPRLGLSLSITVSLHPAPHGGLHTCGLQCLRVAAACPLLEALRRAGSEAQAVVRTVPERAPSGQDRRNIFLLRALISVLLLSLSPPYV